MTPAQQAEIPLSINPHQFLEFLLFSIKGVARRYGKDKKASLNSRKEKAEEMLRRLTALQDDLLNILRAGQNGPVEVAYIGVKATIESKQKELLDIDTHMSSGK